ncbi:MAG: hypothetical protein GDA43_03630 [Hormoscilla sp. SP5CHS1]|nr:hypothetical protein [Hormoscilla sp. SP12CHS1]MBC6452392.1 hypothetical protein [Hormoscilla sp. SP5CHS1]
MKPQLLTSVLAISYLTLAATFTASPSRAQKALTNSFVCGRSNGVPATLARTARSDVPVIRWESNYFSSSDWTPERRCQEVSARFQEYYTNGTLNFLTTGRMNWQPVVCVAESRGGSCAGLLFTLKPGTNPGQTLRNLMEVKNMASGPLSETNGRVYIDMNLYLLDMTPTPTDSGSNSVQPQSDPQPNGTLW